MIYGATGYTGQLVAEELPEPKQNASEVALFYKSSTDNVGPDVQVAFVHVVPGLPGAVVILPGVVQPKSRGTIRLASADPTAPPPSSSPPTAGGR